MSSGAAEIPTSVPRWLTLALVAVLLAAHVALTVRQFPPAAVAGGGVPVKGDVARYFATADGVYRIGGDGYDPTAMAGYPVGTWNSIGKKGYELLGRLLPGVPLGQRFYLILLGAGLILPVFYVWAVSRLVAPVPFALVATIGFALWHLDSQVAYFWQFGNVLYPGSCALIPVLIGLSWAACSSARPLRAAVALGVLAAWVFYAHTAATVAWVVPVAVMVVWQCAVRRSAAPLLWVGFAAVVAGVLVSPWAIDLVRTRGDLVPQPQQWFQAGPKHLLADILGDRGYRRPFDRNLLLHLFGVAGVVGSWLAYRGGNRVVAFVGLAGVWCLVVAYTFSYLPGARSVQPYRFLVPAVFCLGVPSAVALWEGYLVVRAAASPGRRVIAAGLVAFAPGLTAYLLDLTQPPLPCGLTSDERALLDAIKATPSSGRVLCQPDTVAHLVPYWCGKPVLGGLNDQAFVKQRFAGMNEAGVLFGRPLSQWDGPSLRTYLDTYAVEVAVFAGPDWRAFADAHPELFESLGASGGAGLYRVRAAKPDMIHSGVGSASVGADRIRISGASGKLVLKLHYSDLLRLPSGVTSEPVPVLDDPVPFLGLRVEGGASEFEVLCR